MVDSSKFWRMTPRDIRAAIKGYNARTKEALEHRVELDNMAAWVAGKYNSFAQHDPKHYPSKPWELKSGDSTSDAMTDDAMASWAKTFALKHKDMR